MTQKWTHRYQLKPGRWVFAPTDEAKKVGDGIKRSVASRWKPPTFYYHLRNGGHVSAVLSHASSRVFFRADLDDFFGRVNRSRVTRCLKSWFAYAEAREMASESVVKRPDDGAFVLPYGFVQSPILASLALDKSKLGSCLRSLHGSGKVKVSIYVDDIILSGEDEPLLQQAVAQLEQAANASQFPLSTGKTEGPAAGVTAFNIELSHEMLRITDERLTLLRDAYQATESEHRKAGIVSYIESVNPGQVAQVL